MKTSVQLPTDTNFTQLLSLLGDMDLRTLENSLDIKGRRIASTANKHIDLRQMDGKMPSSDQDYEVICCRFGSCLQADVYEFLSTIVGHLSAGGFLILLDYCMPDNEEKALYINSILRLFDTNHRESFAQYAWDGLLLDLGLTGKQVMHQTIQASFKDWGEYYDTGHDRLERLHVMMWQALSSLADQLKLAYAGTQYAQFELAQMICVAQKEAHNG